MPEEQDIRFDEVWERFRDMVASIMRKLKIPLSDEDAWQEARIAVWKALKRFDPSRGGLSTICYSYVFNALVDHRCTRNFGIPYPRQMHRVKGRVRMPVVVSLDERVESRFESSEPLDFVDLIPDRSSRFDFDEVEHRVWCSQLLDCIRRELEGVDEDDLRILEMWLGLGGEELVSFGEIGRRFGLGREVVRWRINKLIRRLRQSDRLASFLNLDEEAGPCISV